MTPEAPSGFHRHERRVERVYTRGSRVNLKLSNPATLELHNGGYLSFGYWESPSDTYPDAARRLLDYFIDQGGIETAERVLNVACGFGTETFAFAERFTPQEIIGIDIARIHTDVASAIAARRGIGGRVRFVHGDAVSLEFPAESFSHILGIEGPAHFRTRERFFGSAHRVLKAGGELILTDVILGPGFPRRTVLQRLILSAARRAWMAPPRTRSTSVSTGTSLPARASRSSRSGRSATRSSPGTAGASPDRSGPRTATWACCSRRASRSPAGSSDIFTGAA